MSADFPLIIYFSPNIFLVIILTLMEAAGFILEAFTDCQLTVITAMVNDNNKDMIKVQNGKSIRYVKFCSQGFITKKETGQAMTLDMITHFEN